MKSFKLIVSIGLFACLVCCKDPSLEISLNCIESLVQVHPDTALMLLRQIDTVSLLRPKDKARYALFQAIALDKNFIDTTDARILAPAIHYYEKKGPDRARMLMWYYLGRIQYNANAYPEAILSLEKAREIGLETEDYRYRGLISAAIADVLSQNYCFQEEESFLQESEIAFENSADTANLWLIRQKRAINFANQKLMGESLQLLDTIISSSDAPSWVISSSYVSRAYERKDTAQTDYSGALSDYLSALSMGEVLSVRDAASYAYVLARSGYRDESDQMFGQLESMGGDDAVISGLFRVPLFVDAGDYETAFRLLKQSLDYQDERVRELLEQSVFKAQRDYYAVQNRLSQMEGKSRQQTIWIILLVTGFVIVALSLLLLFIVRLFKRREVERERLAESLADLDDRIKIIYADQIGRLEEYYREYAMLRATGADERTLYSQLINIIQEIEGDHKAQSYFENLLNEKTGGIMKKLDTACPNLPEKDRRLFAYTVAGFKKSTVCMLLGNISPDALNMRRLRLRKYFRALATEDAAVFEESMRLRD